MGQSIRNGLSSTNSKLFVAAVGVTIATAALVLGGLLAVLGPLYTVALFVVVAAGLWVITDIEHALYSVIAVITLLPFSTLPVKIVLTPTFLDIAMVIVIALYLFEWMTGERRRVHVTSVHAFIILFAILAVFSFVAGLRYAGPTSTVMRRFAELILSIGFALILVDILNTNERIRRFVTVILLSGGLAAFIGVVLWLMPDGLAGSLLGQLAVVGYPNANIIRYVEQNPELLERAISTSVNPNALGGLLVMVTALAVPQFVSERPILERRWLVVVVTAALLACLILTLSRGSILAFTVSVGFLIITRYPRLLWVPFVVLAVVLLLPFGQDIIQRFIEGFQGADLATQMRFGEYKDALILINRYPLLGVGFTGTPDIDIYLGVASVYLTLVGNMGLLGLAAFFVLVGAVFAYAWSARRSIAKITGLEAIWLGSITGLIGALFNGIFDHYFFNLDFHPAVAIFWIYIGLLVAVTRVARTSADTETATSDDIAVTEAPVV